MNYIDNGFLSAVNQVQPSDYIGMFTRGYQVANSLPWSAENQRKRQMEDMAVAMKQQQFAAQMASQAQDMQIKQALLPYQIANYQRRNQPSPTDADPRVGRLAYYNQRLGSPAQPPKEEAAPSQVPPVIPENAGLADPSNPTPRLDLFTDQIPIE